MSNSEDIIMQAYSEGNKDDLFKEVNKLKGDKYKYMETADKFEIAYNNLIKLKKEKLEEKA